MYLLHTFTLRKWVPYIAPVDFAMLMHTAMSCQCHMMEAGLCPGRSMLREWQLKIDRSALQKRTGAPPHIHERYKEVRYYTAKIRRAMWCVAICRYVTSWQQAGMSRTRASAVLNRLEPLLSLFDSAQKSKLHLIT